MALQPKLFRPKRSLQFIKQQQESSAAANKGGSFLLDTTLRGNSKNLKDLLRASATGGDDATEGMSCSELDSGSLREFNLELVPSSSSPREEEEPQAENAHNNDDDDAHVQVLVQSLQAAMQEDAQPSSSLPAPTEENPKVETNPVEPEDTTTTTDNSSTTSAAASPPCSTVKRVTWSTIDVYTHAITLGDHPSCSSGPPLALGLPCQAPVRGVALDEYERHRPIRRPQHEMCVSRADREDWLRAEGFAW
eukprot:CAMPEP_0172454564 /NCGR_PEP_ID=MMETSP1065-20121228/11510_1 /TAXON_ID=265537 /ORGANISM="Amphiprora paludosa, Strain CCMP125" /LENGTH=249 /DNA_ID=CAMNT_0013206911 /DNA_START=105 /DNA_END=851 /DNA_ORIENTATION=-